MKELDTQWPLMMYVGSLFSLQYNSIETGFHKDIGLGAALYLLTLKALGQIFLILTVLNLPAMFIFSRGQDIDSKNLNAFSNMFGRVQIGNLGDDSIGCSYF